MPSALPHRSSIALPLPVSLSMLRHSDNEGMEGALLQGVDCRTAADYPDTNSIALSPHSQKGSKEIDVRILKINCNMIIKSREILSSFSSLLSLSYALFFGIICQFYILFCLTILLIRLNMLNKFHLSAGFFRKRHVVYWSREIDSSSHLLREWLLVFRFNITYGNKTKKR